MEEWNDGMLDINGDFFVLRTQIPIAIFQYNNDPFSQNPLFQYSIIPTRSKAKQNFHDQF
jgi:hypothetical protein